MSPIRPHRAVSVHTQARIAEISARQHGVIAAHQLHTLGLSQRAVRGRARSGSLTEVLPLVYALGLPLGADGLRAAALLGVEGWAVLTGLSGAALLGMVDGDGGPPHTVLVRGRKRAIEGGLQVVRTRAKVRHRRVRGLSVAEPQRVLLDLAMTASDGTLRDAVAHALDRRLVTEAQMRSLPARYPGHPGLRRARSIDLIAARNRRTESPLEREILSVLNGLAVPPWICQHRLRGLSGRRYRLDFAWPELRLALEADGRTVHERRRAMEEDRARDADLAAIGWQTLRVMRRHVGDRRERDAFAQRLAATVAIRVCPQTDVKSRFEDTPLVLAAGRPGLGTGGGCAPGTFGRRGVQCGVTAPARRGVRGGAGRRGVACADARAA